MGNLKLSIYSILLFFCVICLTEKATSENIDEMGSYFEGDIVAISPALEAKTRSGLKDKYFRWPQATVPYLFQPGYPKNLRRLLSRAMRHISARTCVRFVPRTTQTDYIAIIQGDGCFSAVGRIGGPQNVSLPVPCKSFGIFVHELIHALGFFHEQSRTDRGDFVKIIWENIVEGKEHNFKSYSDAVISDFNVKYDYLSIMHYSKTAFSKNGKATILPYKAGAEIGQRKGMSNGDVQKINNMYCGGNKYHQS